MLGFFFSHEWFDEGPVSERVVVRRLAAVLIADAVGYSLRMTDDETRTHRQFMSDMDSVFKPLIGSHSGHVVKTTGDGFLARFDSAVQAVECATAMQQQMQERLAALPPERRMPYRMGINAGDIIIEPEDVYGDDVNLARRLEEMATRRVYITAAVLRYLRGSHRSVEDFGAHQFKSSAGAQQVSRIRIGGGAVPTAVPPTTRQYHPAEPAAIAVLPFEILSSDPSRPTSATASPRTSSASSRASASSMSFPAIPPSVIAASRWICVRWGANWACIMWWKAASAGRASSCVSPSS
jgi:adenylate cyclase